GHVHVGCTMSHCRFENRLSGSALELRGLKKTIRAHAPQELDAAFSAIEAAQAQGMWIALLLDYEVGEWLEPAARSSSMRGGKPQPHDTSRPRFTALAYETCVDVPIWQDDTSDMPLLSAQCTVEKTQYLDAVGQ